MTVVPALETADTDRGDLAIRLFFICGFAVQVAWLAFLVWLPLWTFGII